MGRGCDDAPVIEFPDLILGSLFDRNLCSRFQRLIECRHRRRDIERDFIVFRYDCQSPRTDFVCHIAVCGNAVRADKDQGHLGHERCSHVVTDGIGFDAVPG